MPLLGTFGAGSSRGYGQKGGAPKFIIATGGTETTEGDYKIHTFASPGTLCISCSGNSLGNNEIEYLVVAGGGGGGGFQVSGFPPYGQYGGAGGYRQSSGETAGCYPVGNSPTAALAAGVPGVKGLSGPISITVGAGGSQNSTPGSNSVFGPISSTGGGRGRFQALPGLPGGGGGGGGGSGNAGGYSPPEGFSVGAGNGTLDYPFKGNGYRADGQNTLIEGPFPTTTVGESLNSTRWFSGCGGQSGQDFNVYLGGAGGGGSGTNGGPAAANTGGGGGAGGSQAGGGSGSPTGGNGGSGAVILRYKFQ